MRLSKLIHLAYEKVSIDIGMNSGNPDKEYCELLAKELIELRTLENARVKDLVLDNGAILISLKET